MSGRNPSESTKDWLERLVGSGATDAQLNAVRSILESENRAAAAPSPGKLRCYFVDYNIYNDTYYFLSV
jgi:hypothetical protein